MKKWQILVGVIIIVLIVNGLFWLWLGQDSTPVVKVDFEKMKEFKNDLIEFQYPNSLIYNETDSGAMWFNSIDQGVMIFYDTFERDAELNFESQFNKNVLGGQVCPIKSQKNNYVLYYACKYLKSVFTIINFEKDDHLVVLGLNHNYFSEDDINLIILSLNTQ